MKRTTLKRYTPLSSRSKKRREGDLIYSRNRQRALMRDGWRCRRCGTGFSLVVHHLLPRSAGGAHDLDNLAVLCDTDHRWVHAHPLHAEAEGLLRRRRAA